MCSNEASYIQPGHLTGVEPTRGSDSRLFRILLLFIFSALFGLLSAQSNRDEYEVLRHYELPDSAVSISDLSLAEGAYLLDGLPFTGLAFERYTNQKLLRVISLRDGIQHGPMYLWYPDGKPQMSTNYRHGRLHGRFLGWYMTGGIIYDMVINHGAYAGDFIEDETRRLEETADAEGEGADSDRIPD